MLRTFLAASALFAAQAATAKTCDLSIDASDAMQYSTKELTVAKDCTDVKLKLTHTGKLPKTAMGHNWVLSAEADQQGIIAAGMKEGVANDYLPKNDPKVIASTKLIGGGESAETTFKAADLKAGTTYKFFCTFPGHSGIMNGTVAVK